MALGIGAALALIVGVTAVAVVVLRSGSGSSSPQDAASAWVEAYADRDADAAWAVLDPEQQELIGRQAWDCFFEASSYIREGVSPITAGRSEEATVVVAGTGERKEVTLVGVSYPDPTQFTGVRSLSISTAKRRLSHHVVLSDASDDIIEQCRFEVEAAEDGVELTQCTVDGTEAVAVVRVRNDGSEARTFDIEVSFSTVDPPIGDGNLGSDSHSVEVAAGEIKTVTLTVERFVGPETECRLTGR